MQINHANLSHEMDHGGRAAITLRSLACASPSPATEWLAKMGCGLGKRLPLQLQSDAAGSGLSCIGMLAGYHDLLAPSPLPSPARPRSIVAPFSFQTLAQLIQSAGIVGLHCRPLRIPAIALATLKLPAILQTHGAHYVVLKSLRKDRLTLHDPASGIVVLSREQMARRFTGIAIEVEPSGKFCEQDLPGARESGGLSDHLGDAKITPHRKILPVAALVLAVIFLTGHFANS